MTLLCRVPVLAVFMGAGAFAGPVSPVLAETGLGTLAGRTSISLGCPGPARAGEPCERRIPFPHARFSVTRLGPDGRPLPLTVRVIVADATSRFSVRLRSGNYLVTPLPGPRALPGQKLTAEVRPGFTTWAAVRYASKVEPV